ncbi:HmuY family protein [uncultured Chitinophaga sp.]|uniref:HmuY family protein n=1 Tax=uncultured Chitinophaga sp. TaxID=339340 RepID=UPI0025FA81F9|nr:HmuY family protein [uncultured Chitinophaga sp.]
MHTRTALLATLLLFAACKKEDNNVKKDTYEDGVSTVIYDLAGDTEASVGEGADGKVMRPFKPFFFRFNGKQQSWDSSATNRQSNSWDIAFTDVYNALVYPNSGTDGRNPGYGGAGKGLIVMVDKPYASVTQAPTEAEMKTNNLGFVGWDGYPQPYNDGWYFYSLQTHLAIAIRNRTFVLLTAEGKFAKLELINVYKGNPPAVTDLHWPAPYFTFRYFVQEDGSRNLKTP